MVAIGIDLGTTNSLAAIFTENGTPQLISTNSDTFLLPSAVSISNSGAILVGAAAKSREVVYPNLTATKFKRLMGTKKSISLGKKTFSPIDLSALVLKELLYNVEHYVQEPIESLVITVPAYFNSVQREHTLLSASIAGVEATRLINEPTAAAMAYGLQDKDGESTFVVLDLGGGTFDVSILEMFEGVMEVRSSSGDAFLGGEDFTQILATNLAQNLGDSFENYSSENQAKFIFAAQEIKHALSDNTSATVNLTVNNVNHKITKTRDEFEDICAELTMRMRRPIERCLYDAKLTVDDIDRVILVGGATRMPFVRSLASRLFRKLPERTFDPDYVVAMGAAVQSALCLKHEALNDVVMTDVSPFSLGILSRNETIHGAIEGAFVPIIERNTILPASRSQLFSTVSNNQTKILVAIFQGEAPIAQDNVLLGQIEVSVPACPAGQESISVRFSYDINGLLQVEVMVLSTNITREIIIDNGGKKLNAAAKRESLRKLEKLKFHPREDTINQEVLEELNTLYAMHLGEDRELIQGLIAQFMAAMDTQDPRKVTAERETTKEAIKNIKNNYVL